jgi:hypothetical protein
MPHRPPHRVALEELSTFTPLLVVELRSWRGTQEVVLVPELVIRNDSIDVSSTPLAATTGEARTADGWRQALSSDAWQFHEQFASMARDTIGPITIDYSPKSYIGIGVGRRVWAPLWPRKDCAQLYLPDPDQSRNEEPPAFAHFRDLLTERGLNIGWQTTYNAGANPITLRLRTTDLSDPAVQEFLKATYQAAQPGTSLRTVMCPPTVDALCRRHEDAPDQGPARPKAADEDGVAAARLEQRVCAGNSGAMLVAAGSTS